MCQRCLANVIDRLWRRFYNFSAVLCVTIVYYRRDFEVRPKTAKIACPKKPEHGLATKRWLRGEYRQATNEFNGAQIADMYEIACPVCGKYEIRQEIEPKQGASHPN